MPLQKQSVAFSLIKGLNTKTDSKQVPFGQLLSLENSNFDKLGKIQKRNGYNTINNTILGSGDNIASGKALATFKDELLAFDTDNAYSYVDGINQWADKGAVSSVYVTSSPVDNGTARELDYDFALHPDGLQCYVFSKVTATGYSLNYIIRDSTGQIVVPTTVISTQGQSPKVICFDNSFVIYYYDETTTRINRGILAVGNPTATISFSAITSSANDEDSVDTAVPFYDIEALDTRALGTQIYLVFNNRTAAGGTTLRRYAQPGTLTAQVAIANEAMIAGTVFYDQFNDGPVIAYCWDSGADYTLTYRIYSALIEDSLGAADQLKTDDIIVDQSIHITGISLSQDQQDIRIFADSLSASGGGVIADYTAIAASFTLTTEYNLSHIAAKAFAYNGNAYLPVVSGSQSTYFILREDGQVVAKAFAGLAGGTNEDASTQAWVPSIEAISDTEFIFPVLEVSTFGTVSGATLTGVSTVKLDFFEPEKSYSRGEIASNLHIGGGFLSMYDGVNVVEHGFHWYPGGLLDSPVAPGSTYTYSYVAVFEWTDNYGNLHRSAPSDPYEVTTGSPIDGTNSVDWLVRPLTLTAKTASNGRSPVLIVLYRTENNGSIYYRLPVDADNINNTAVNRQPLPTDVTTDADLVGYPQLYTTGGVVENDAPPPVGAITIHQNRLFTLDSTNPLVLWYSKLVSPGVPAEFSAFQTLDIDPSGGPVTALASMDDNLIVFKETSIRRIIGDGPDSTGANGQFNPSTLVTTDAGCVNQRSIVTVPQGLLFKSRKGIYLLDRGLNVSYLGAPVEDFNAFEPTSAVLMPTKNQVRITLDTNRSLVWDYLVSQWSVDTNISATDSVIWQNEHVYIRSNGDILQQSTGYTDDGAAISMGFNAAWWSFEGLSGFQRVYKLYLLGAWKSDHRLSVKLYYDFNNSYAEEIIVTPTAPSVYGTGLYGEETPYGGNYEMSLYEIRPSRQKCIAMKVSVRDIPAADGSFGEGYDLSNVRIVYGVKGSGARLKDGQVFGGNS